MARIIASDFDGTITTHDTLPLLLKHCFGPWRFVWGVLCCLPWIALYKLHLMDGGPAKQRLMRHFFGGMTHEEFCRLCSDFANLNSLAYTRVEPTFTLRDAANDGDTVLVVTASASEWVAPWLNTAGLSHVQVIGTKMEIDDHGLLTGRFASPNCNGAEKWRRIVEAVPQAEGGLDAAYGDSRGDSVMLSHATRAYYRNFTTPQDQLPFWQRHKGVIFWTVMAVLVLYQMLGVFFGMDVADAGFYLTFYDNIFSHPASVQYNFMYYLSGVIGGTLQSVCPGMGMLGMRLAGVTFNSLAGIVLYLALRNHVDERAIALGCALVVVSFIAPPYTLSYDLCTILFYVVTIALLWRGIMTDNIFLFSLAGFVAGLNVLVRIPNVLGLSLALLPVIIAAYNQLRYGHDSEWRLAILHAVTFLLGSALAISLVLLLMPAEHYVAFMQVLDDLQSMATDTSGTASHTTGQMIMTQLRFYATEAWTAVKLAVPVAAYWWAGRKTVNKWLAVAVKVAAVALMVWFVARMHPLQPLWVMCMAGCVAAMLRSDSPWLRWIALSALGIMLIMPLGSDSAYNNGSIIAWAAAPVAALWWIGRNRAALPLTLLAVCAVRMVAGGAYFDGGSLLDKQFTVHNARAAHIHTTHERAQVLNTLLLGIRPHVKPGTTLMAYGSIPALNYLTRTHPYIGCSWVEQLSAARLQQKLERAALADGLPLVLRQKFNTIGMQWSKPSTDYLTHYGEQNAYQDNRKLEVLNRFLHDHHYIVVYQDTHFVLYRPLPPAPSPPPFEPRRPSPVTHIH